MKKKFYLTMMLLLSMAVGTTYADDDPSVVTLFEYSFADGMGEFTSVSSLDGATNSAWKYNEELKCVECSGEESGYLITPEIIARDNKYFSISLTFEHQGANIESYEFDFRVGLVNTESQSTSWSYYSTGDPHYWGSPIDAPSSSDFSSCGAISLDYNCRETAFKLAIGVSPSTSNGKYYRIKNFKITAKDWEQSKVQETQSISEITALKEGTLVKFNMNQVPIVFCDSYDKYAQYIYDNTGGLKIPFAFKLKDVGKKASGFMYGIFAKDEEIPMLTSVYTSNIELAEIAEEEQWPKEIAENEYWDNVMNYVRMPITSEVLVWDKFKHLDGFYTHRNYIPVYESYFTGLLVPTQDGEKRFLITDKKSVEIVLPEIMETPLTENEFDLWGRTNRVFKADEWYTICVPWQNRLSEYGKCATMVSAADGILNFHTDVIECGHPGLIKFYKDCNELSGSIQATEPVRISGAEYNFVGTLQTVSPKDGSLYLTAGNTIRPLATGGKINAFRAYFEPNTPSAARTRSIVVDGTTIATGDGTTTDIEDILNGRTNGNGEVYNLNGQRVNGNSSQKGVYIINGKKVIK